MAFYLFIPYSDQNFRYFLKEKLIRSSVTNFILKISIGSLQGYVVHRLKNEKLRTSILLNNWNGWPPWRTVKIATKLLCCK